MKTDQPGPRSGRARARRPAREPAPLPALLDAVLRLETQEECRSFFTDLCTPAELAALADRWRAARLLAEGVPYRAIYDRTGVSTATVTRVARALTSGEGGYRMMLSKLGKGRSRS